MEDKTRIVTYEQMQSFIHALHIFDYVRKIIEMNLVNLLQLAVRIVILVYYKQIHILIGYLKYINDIYRAEE